MELEYSFFTNEGDRPVNEDSIGFTEKDGRYCFVLCDGLGGHGKGELASRYVVEYAKCFFDESTDNDSYMETVLDNAQEGLLAEQIELDATFQMKTTAVVLTAVGERCRYMHIGDSRLYRFRKNKVMKRTMDHSVPQMLAMSGDIKEKQIRSHPDRNRLLRVMGSKWTSGGAKYELSETEDLKAGDAFLLCSDGFWEPITEKEMCKLLKKSSSAEDWLRKMAETVRENGKDTNMDNFSAIAVCVKG
ncbi:PP2C family protein-serine/threonine phosphatase [Ruminococcus albus]|uniref:Serine/threonine protein phosphatase PrpC n=1 Tax=Ruminococcus albus TaxID=1264 RepID=A0A1I1HXG2_RUMAL|nr:protein phosphatase 2C domain-containing protein [Ruminococcus albus]SFC28475.1 Serine/threonine protein phosphatase PrpC [Ruminococcus albus]